MTRQPHDGHGAGKCVRRNTYGTEAPQENRDAHESHAG